MAYCETARYILLLCDFLGYAKQAGIFLGRQILNLGFFGV